ncbi:MAG: hypothetical protein GY839_11750 [candidate division Zixibacteria bacterium]|nr:hypothetical protein [candidate division Zixibacteria bacterium]
MAKCIDPQIGSLLYAYELKGLSEKEIERFEIHLLKCDYCLNEVNEFKDHAAIINEDDAVKQIVQDSVGDKSITISLWRQLWRHLWPEAKFVFKPAVSYLVIFLLAFPAIDWLTYHGKDEVRTIFAVTLLAERSPTDNIVPRDCEVAINFSFREVIEGHSYQISIKSKDDKIVYVIEDYSGFNKYDNVCIYLPANMLKSGRYSLTIKDLNDESLSVEQTYYFDVR